MALDASRKLGKSTKGMAPTIISKTSGGNDRILRAMMNGVARMDDEKRARSTQEFLQNAGKSGYFPVAAENDSRPKYVSGDYLCLFPQAMANQGVPTPV